MKTCSFGEFGCSAVATSAAAEKNGNMGAQLHSLRCTKQPQRYFGKFTCSTTFRVHKLFIPSHFLTTRTNF